MKIMLEQATLAEMANMVVRAAAPTGSIITSLSGLHLKASNGTLTATSQDMELAIKVISEEVEIVEEGEVLVNAHYFTDLINKVKGIVTMEKDEKDNILLIKYGRSKGKINLLSVSEWVEPKLEEGFIPKLTLKVNDLTKALKETMYASAKEHFRPVFTGVLLDIQKDNKCVNVVASNTHRLSLYPLAYQDEIKEDEQLIIPTKHLNEFLRCFRNTDEDDEITISSNGNSIVISSEKVSLLTRILDGQYPNYMGIVPKTEFDVKLKTQMLKNSLERIRTLPKKNNININDVRFTINGNGEMEVFSSSELAGEIKEKVMLEEGSSKLEKELQISFNVEYLHDYLKLCSEEVVNIGLSGPLTPALITTEGSTTKYVVVPLRVS